MTRNHEKLLVAALAGIIIAGAAVFAIQPAMAQSHSSGVRATSLSVAPSYDVLSLRLADKA